ncbi:magnesium transporter CorA family protein [Planococcus sp. CAU13]|uniref:magnesium transporter CorA family protein n=1 Tax=Planococcus sp. CAU13 TaxID=1541197 RepID=UPI00052FE08C|nr:magnesium transporter CorA family protein [Planococcus sp. CAU13]
MPKYTFKHAVWHEEASEIGNGFVHLLPEHIRRHSWRDESKDMTVNILHVDTSMPGEEKIWGSLIYRHSPKDKKDMKTLHFYLSKDILLTNRLDYEEDEDMDQERIHEHMEHAGSTTELLMILLGAMTGSLLHKIDVFEERLHQLLWEIKEKNNRNTLAEIENVRHEILLWKNVILGFIEMKMVMPETFGKEILENPEYYRTSSRISRMEMLINAYEHEVNNMVDMENVVANYRGNEIMKTLTVLTTLFTPVMAFGALWGMNFEHMPELEWTFGYLASLIIIVLSTAILYFYLKNKGWTGDILQTLKRDSNVKNSRGE